MRKITQIINKLYLLIVNGKKREKYKISQNKFFRVFVIFKKTQKLSISFPINKILYPNGIQITNLFENLIPNTLVFYC